MEDALKIQEPQQIVLVQAMLAGVQLEQRQSRENGRLKIRLRGLRDGGAYFFQHGSALRCKPMLYCCTAGGRCGAWRAIFHCLSRPFGLLASVPFCGLADAIGAAGLALGYLPGLLHRRRGPS